MGHPLLTRFCLSVFLQAKPTSNKSGGKHSLFTHLAKDPNCEVCRRTKVTSALCRRCPDGRVDRIKIAERFGDMVTADHKVLSEEQESRLHHSYAVVMQDLATQSSQSCPCKKPTQLNMGGRRKLDWGTFDSGCGRSQNHATN